MNAPSLDTDSEYIQLFKKASKVLLMSSADPFILYALMRT
jgi:hypothetical protein